MGLGNCQGEARLPGHRVLGAQPDTEPVPGAAEERLSLEGAPQTQQDAP